MSHNFPHVLKIYQSLVLCIMVVAGLLVTGCQSDTSNLSGDLKYYNLQGLFENQISLLERTNAKAYKETKLDKESEGRLVEEVDWKKELQPFIQADINKPAYTKSYSIANPDSKTILYTQIPNGNLLVQELAIKLDSTNKKPLEIRAKLHSRNQLYQSDRELVATFSKGVLKSYSVKGFQKLAILSQRNFSISVTIQ